MISGISNHWFGRVRIRLSIADVAIVTVVGILVVVFIVAPMNKVSAHRIRCRHSQCPCFVQIVIHHRSAGSTSGRDGHRRRLSRPCVLRVLGSTPYRAQIHRAPLLASTASRQSLPRPRYPYRFTCSRDECGVVAGLSDVAVWLCSLRLVFCLPFRIWGYEPWLIFPIQS